MRIKWDYQKLSSEALKYENRTDFQLHSKAAYNAAYRRGIIDQICSHMKTLRIRWDRELVEIEALKYKTRSSFQNESGGAYMYALSNGFLEDVCSHMPKHVDQSGENNPAFKWTDEMLRSELGKYNSLKELREKSYGAYQAAIVRNDFKEMVSHMPAALNEAYTKEELQTIISRYDTRVALARGNQSVYVIACKRDDYEELCSNMRPARGPSMAEKEIFGKINEVFPNTKSFKDRKVKIEGRPHIQGFDIDIYVPELCKGIEFDGRYYHSFEGLKRSRSHWPDQDILNYHQIKDNYFLSKGIQILHIKEEDWLKDKQACIDRCFHFLKGDSCP